jgi:cellobiose phosphorylase
MLRTKEILADRPHAHIMQAKVGFSPDENIVSTTAFAFGVFNSHISQGNTNFGVLLSVCTSQFNASPESGQRIFVSIDGIFYLLGVPSAFEMGLNHCRWIYKTADHCFQIRTWTSVTSPRINMDFKVISGTDVRLLITHDFDTLNSWKIISGDEPHQFVAKPASDSMVSRKFPNARFRILVNNNHSGYRACGDEVLYSDSLHNGSLFILDIGATANFSVSFIGEVCSEVKALPLEDSEQQWLVDSLAGQSFWKQMSLNLSAKVDQKDAKAIYEILPWYGMNAITHFLTPYGLEQFSGAAWGTRDVAQGPLDLLLTLEKYDAARQALLIIFSNQNTEGGWPQWWMFDSFSEIRAQDSHGDVFYWVIIALSNYIKVTGDLKILEEFVPYYQENSSNGIEKYPVSEHIDRLIRMIINSFIPGTSLVPFGGGDWNDSLQPVSRELARSMISSWTVEMNYQAFNHYCAIYDLSGDTSKARELADICERIKGDFNKFLVEDGVVAGYGLVNKDGSISVMLHPRDNTTGVHYSLLPMERGIISEIFTREQAEHHQELIEKYLKGPDGARLMDRPLKYQGGIQTIFQRAESSTFFGREIGLMYVHEHIRYAESLARTGRAEEFVKALRQAIPVEYREIVPCGDIRQSNCYYSSSDVAFKSRYEADEHYKEIQSGNITLRGGWRVYSSGPGIYVSMIVTRLLGLRIEFGKVIFDPVLPYSMDGMSASLDFMGHSVTFRYAVRESCHSPKSIDVNGKTMKFTLENNKYRTGGAVIPAEKFLAMLDQLQNVVDIQL